MPSKKNPYVTLKIRKELANLIDEEIKKKAPFYNKRSQVVTEALKKYFNNQD